MVNVRWLCCCLLLPFTATADDIESLLQLQTDKPKQVSLRAKFNTYRDNRQFKRKMVKRAREEAVEEIGDWQAHRDDRKNLVVRLQRKGLLRAAKRLASAKALRRDLQAEVKKDKDIIDRDAQYDAVFEAKHREKTKIVEKELAKKEAKVEKLQAKVSAHESALKSSQHGLTAVEEDIKLVKNALKDTTEKLGAFSDEVWSAEAPVLLEEKKNEKPIMDAELELKQKEMSSWVYAKQLEIKNVQERVGKKENELEQINAQLDKHDEILEDIQKEGTRLAEAEVVLAKPLTEDNVDEKELVQNQLDSIAQEFLGLDKLEHDLIEFGRTAILLRSAKAMMLKEEYDRIVDKIMQEEQRTARQEEKLNELIEGTHIEGQDLLKVDQESKIGLIGRYLDTQLEKLHAEMPKMVAQAKELQEHIESLYWEDASVADEKSEDFTDEALRLDGEINATKGEIGILEKKLQEARFRKSPQKVSLLQDDTEKPKNSVLLPADEDWAPSSNWTAELKKEQTQINHLFKKLEDLRPRAEKLDSAEKRISKERETYAMRLGKLDDEEQSLHERDATVKHKMVDANKQLGALQEKADGYHRELALLQELYAHFVKRQQMLSDDATHEGAGENSDVKASLWADFSHILDVQTEQVAVRKKVEAPLREKEQLLKELELKFDDLVNKDVWGAMDKTDKHFGTVLGSLELLAKQISQLADARKSFALRGKQALEDLDLGFKLMHADFSPYNKSDKELGLKKLLLEQQLGYLETKNTKIDELKNDIDQQLDLTEEDVKNKEEQLTQVRAKMSAVMVHGHDIDEKFMKEEETVIDFIEDAMMKQTGKAVDETRVAFGRFVRSRSMADEMAKRIEGQKTATSKEMQTRKLAEKSKADSKYYLTKVLDGAKELKTRLAEEVRVVA